MNNFIYSDHNARVFASQTELILNFSKVKLDNRWKRMEMTKTIAHIIDMAELENCLLVNQEKAESVVNLIRFYNKNFSALGYSIVTGSMLEEIYNRLMLVSVTNHTESKAWEIPMPATWFNLKFVGIKDRHDLFVVKHLLSRLIKNAMRLKPIFEGRRHNK